MIFFLFKKVNQNVFHYLFLYIHTEVICLVTFVLVGRTQMCLVPYLHNLLGVPTTKIK